MAQLAPATDADGARKAPPGQAGTPPPSLGAGEEPGLTSVIKAILRFITKVFTLSDHDAQSHSTPSARLLQSNIDIYASTPDSGRRAVSRGAPIFEGDTLIAPAGAAATVVFRDGTRMAIQDRSRIRIERFSYDSTEAVRGQMSIELIEGAIRAQTGELGKAAPSNVNFTTKTATVGIRGTDLHLLCASAEGSPSIAPGQDCFVQTLKGAVVISAFAAPEVKVTVAAGKAAKASGSGEPATLVEDIPALMRANPLPDPGRLEVDLAALFAQRTKDGNDLPGPFAYMRGIPLSLGWLALLLIALYFWKKR